MTDTSIPVGGMPADALPQPARAELRDGMPLTNSNPARGGMQTQLHDLEIQREQWVLVYPTLSAAAARSIQAHYRDNRQGFAWILNAHGSTTKEWRHVSHPQITFRTRQLAQARVVLELLTPHN